MYVKPLDDLSDVALTSRPQLHNGPGELPKPFWSPEPQGHMRGNKPSTAQWAGRAPKAVLVPRASRPHAWQQTLDRAMSRASSQSRFGHMRGNKLLIQVVERAMFHSGVE